MCGHIYMQTYRHTVRGKEMKRIWLKATTIPALSKFAHLGRWPKPYFGIFLGSAHKPEIHTCSWEEKGFAHFHGFVEFCCFSTHLHAYGLFPLFFLNTSECCGREHTYMLAHELVCWFVGAESLAYLVDSDNLPNCLGHFFFLPPPAVLRKSCCSAPLLTLSLVNLGV